LIHCASLEGVVSSVETGHGASQRQRQSRLDSTALAHALFQEGKIANVAGNTWLARELFERAYMCAPRLAFLLSIGNMHLKLGEPALARAFYEHVDSVASSSPKEVEMARRKMSECDGQLAPQRAALAHVLQSDDVRDSESCCRSAGSSCVAGAAGEPVGSQGSVIAGAAPSSDFLRVLRDQLFSVGSSNGSREVTSNCGANASSAPPAQMLHELQQARAAAAVALSAKATVEGLLAEQHKSHRRAKASQKALQEVATQLEVEVVAAAQKDDDAANMRSLIDDQQKQIAELTAAQASLAAQLAAAGSGN